MFCSECGRQNRDTAKFCVGCGEPTQELTVGTLLQGRYLIEGPLGSGAMGSVYRVRDHRLDCHRALKVLAAPKGTDEERQEAVRRFEQEARIVSSLHHQSLPPVQDFFSEMGRHFLVQTLIEGVNLEQYLRTHGQPGLAEDWVVGVAIQLLTALEYLHQRTPPIVFRDLKPANVMLELASGRIFLIDFGIARYTTGAVGTAIGTEGYAPPEQYAGRAEPRSDLYSLAATMHHLLSGQVPNVPFHHEPIEKLVPGVSSTIQSVLKSALTLDVNGRFPSAAEMMAALRFTAHIPTVAANAPVPNPQGPGGSFGHSKVSGGVGRKKVIHFPSDHSLGQLEVWRDDKWIPLGEAVADVTVRTDERIRFRMARGTTDTGLMHIQNLTRLQELDLSDTQVTDAGLVHLKRLTALSNLNLSGTWVTGAGFVHLKRLTALSSLNLSQTQVTDAGLVHLKRLTALSSLNLSWTNVTDAGLVHLEGLTALSRLDLTYTKVTDAGLVHLNGLTALSSLDLWWTQVTDVGLVHLEGLTALSSLDLPDQVTDTGLVHLKGLNALSSLDLSGTQVTDAGLVHLKGLTALSSLDLSRTQVADAGLVHLKGLTALSRLHLSGTQVTDAGLVHLKGLNALSSLFLGGTQVTDAGLVHLKGLNALSSLFLGGTQVTDAGLVHLKGLNALSSLDLPDQVTDTGLVHLKGLTALSSLDLSRTQVTDAGLVHLKGLTALSSLDLSRTQVADAGLVHLKGLIGLSRLHLTYTQVTDVGLVHLKGLTALSSLNLSWTQVTEAGLVHLKGLTALSSLNLSRTQVTEAGLTALSSLNLCNIQVGDYDELPH